MIKLFFSSMDTWEKAKIGAKFLLENEPPYKKPDFTKSTLARLENDRLRSIEISMLNNSYSFLVLEAQKGSRSHTHESYHVTNNKEYFFEKLQEAINLNSLFNLDSSCFTWTANFLRDKEIFDDSEIEESSSLYMIIRNNNKERVMVVKAGKHTIRAKIKDIFTAGIWVEPTENDDK